MSITGYGNSERFTNSAGKGDYIKFLNMQNPKDDNSKDKKDNLNQSTSAEKHNPFQEADRNSDPEESPEEEAQAEQQRKEALTERD